MEQNALRHSARAVFDRALEIESPAHQQAYLAEACGADAALRQEVDALLHAHQEAGSFLEAALPDLGLGLGATLDQPSGGVREGPGTVMGPYKLLQQIGEGGMGVVFLAEQTRPVRRQVALKIIKAGMDSRQVIARFEAERQALAMMDHVNIARVLDAGATEAGLPYFVMELVHGVPITQYCDDNRLSPRQRLELFVPVCQAIQHAHQKGIIHRDIKPTNVMVTLYDGKPVPKVIDFGVAKATEQRLTERTLFTNYGTMVGTLEYMSPEQAEMSALGADTRSDIFSLGVLLYELLTGSTPLTHKRLKAAAYGEVLRLIREEEAPKPSTRLSDSGAALASISAQRHMEPAKLTKLMRGELDWIVMKTLEKDRGRRYETAKDFAADLQRYLNDETVQACPPSVRYRFRKFARRNRAALVMASLALLAILLVTATAGWAVRDRQNRQAAVAARAEQTLGESETLYRQRKLPEAMQLARNALTIMEGGAGGPAVERRARAWLKDLDMVARLEELHPDTFAEGGQAAKLLDYAQAFQQYGIDIEALAPAEAAARIAARPIRVDLAVSLDRWGDYLHPRGEVPSEKEAALGSRLRQIASLADPDPLRNQLRDPQMREDTAKVEKIAASLDLATTPIATLLRIGDAHAWPDPMIAFYTRLQKHHPDDFAINSLLGTMLWRGDPDKSRGIRFLTAAVSLRPGSWVAHDHLAEALYRAGIADEAILEFQETIRLNPKAVMGLRLGQALLSRGREQEALAAYGEGLRLRSINTNAYFHIGVQYAIWGKKDAALAAYRVAARVQPDDPFMHCTLGKELANRGLVDEAIAAYRQAIRVEPEFAEAHLQLGNELKKKGLPDQAMAAYREVVRLKPADAYAHKTFVVSLLGEKDLLEEIITSYREAARGAPGNAVAHADLGFVMEKTGRLDEAIASYREAVRLRPADGDLQHRLGNVYGMSGQWDKAAGPFNRAFELDQSRDWRAGYIAAELSLYTGDTENYRRICRYFVDSTASPIHRGICASIAFTCALSPGFGADPDRIMNLSKIAMRGTEGHPDRQRFEITQGLVDYRAGRFDAAAEMILHAAPSIEGKGRDAAAFLILAMAQHRLGKRDESRNSFENAQRIIATNMLKVERGETFGDDWPRWVYAQIFYREAEQVMKEPPPSSQKSR